MRLPFHSTALGRCKASNAANGSTASAASHSDAGRDRVGAQDHLGEQTERAERSDEQSRQVEPGHVLHRRAPAVDDPPFGGHVPDLQHARAQRASTERVDVVLADRSTAPPTVPPRSTSDVRWPRSRSAACSSSTGVPARTRTVISSGGVGHDARRGGDDPRPDASTDRRRSHRVPPPRTAIGPSSPTSSANASSTGSRSTSVARHPHTPVGTLRSAWMSAQLCPTGNTLPGFARHAGSNARRRRSWWSRSSSVNMPRHVRLLLDADAVLAGQHPAGVERRGDDLRSRGVHPFEHARLAPVEQQQRMQVAVAGVEHVHHDQVVTVGDLVDLLEHVGELRPGHDGVVEVVVGRDLGDRPEGRLAALPEQLPLGIGTGEADLGRTVAPPDRRRSRRRRSPTPASSPSTSARSTAVASVGKPAST